MHIEVRAGFNLAEVLMTMNDSSRVKRLMPCNQQLEHSFLIRGKVTARLIVLIQTTYQTDPDTLMAMAFSVSTPVINRSALIRSHQWHQWLLEGKYRTIKELAERDNIKNNAYPPFIISLYSLSPQIQQAIVTGEALDDIKPIRELRRLNIPAEWSLQREILFQTC